MIRAVALVAGDGTKLQSILDALYFNELPGLQLAAVISSEKDCNALLRAQNFHIPSFFVDPELFPNITSHSLAIANKLNGSDDLHGVKIALQGLGHVGFDLAHQLHEAGADLIVSTHSNRKNMKVAVEEWGAKEVSDEEIYGTECDILSPCALGATINYTTLPMLKCRAIAGAANNQLLDDECGKILRSKGMAAFEGAMVTVSEVRVSPDLSIAKTYVSIFPSEKAASVMGILNDNLRAYRGELGRMVAKQLRIVPEIDFFLDTSIDYAEHIEELLKK